MSKKRSKGRIGRTIHRVVNSSPARKIKTGLFYAPLAVGGIALAKQIGRIPGVSDLAGGLEMKFSQITHLPWFGDLGNNLVEIGGSAALLEVASLLTKKTRKREDFQVHELGQSRLGKQQRLFRAIGRHGRNAVLAAGAGALLLATYDSVPNAVEWLNNTAHMGLESVASGIGSAYEKMFVESDHWYSVPAKVAGALGLTSLAGAVHSRWSSTRHAPIKKNYFVDGYMPAMRWTSMENIKLAIKKLPINIWRSEAMNLVGDDMRVTADVTVYDYKTGKEKEGGRIFYDPGIEPVRSRGEITDVDVAMIRHILKSKATDGGEEVKILGRDVEALVRDSKVYDAITDHFRRHKMKNPPSLVDVNSVLQVMQSDSYAERNIDDISDSTILQERKKTSVYQRGGRFFRSFWGKDAGDSLVEVANINENTAATISQSRREYGKHFLKRGKVCVALAYRTFRGAGHHVGGDEVTDEDIDVTEMMDMNDHDFDQEFSSQVATNQLREIRKYWNTFAEHGAGGMYSMQFHGGAFTIEQEWMASLPVWRDRALRRKYYVRDSSGEVVAKMQETWATVIGKPLGNINWSIDVYDSDLAQTDAFGGLLCLMTDYFTHHKKYSENRRSDLFNHSGGGYEGTMAA